MDTISINNLQIHLINGLGPSAFGLTNPPPCPISLTLHIRLKDGIVSEDEDSMLGLGVNYSAVSKEVYALLSDRTRVWSGPSEVLQAAAELPFKLDAVQAVDIRLELPRALLHAKSAVYEAVFTPERGEVTMGISGLQVACVIGLHPHERAERQRLEVDLRVKGWKEGLGHRRVADILLKYLENSSFGTIESLAHSLAAHVLSELNDSGGLQLELTIRKPSAIPFGVPSITIRRSSVSSSHAGPSTSPPLKTAALDALSPPHQRIFIALGSNIGHRISNFNRAIELLEEYGCEAVRTGRLYESEPMYVEDQDRFMNSAIEVRTKLVPMNLMRVLKRVEREVGRVKTFTNGPRVIDLDLIYYGDEVIKIGKKGDVEGEDGVGWLEVPHWGIGEREFVLRPLADIAPDFLDPRLRLPLHTLLGRLPRAIPPQLSSLAPFPQPALPLRLNNPTPRIMAIINATPDSFSDGSTSNLSISHVLSTIRAIFDTPFPPHMLDIGGMSTRPNSIPCSEGEELDRVIPLIQAIRMLEDQRIASIPISIDTYRPEVARAAVEAGASCINDVRGGREEGMLQTMAELGVPVVLMHSRGDSTSMTTSVLQDYSAQGGVVKGVIKEMREMVQKAEEAGVKRWNIILDPGLGFAKKGTDNLVLLKHLKELTGPGSGLEGYPILVGGSRKGFVGKVIGRDVPVERGMGDAAVAAWCCSQKVEIIRVHDARAAGEAMGMLAAISAS